MDIRPGKYLFSSHPHDFKVDLAMPDRPLTEQTSIQQNIGKLHDY